MKSSEKEEEERRVSREIRAEIMEKIQSIVQRSMEKAIADEIFERVKIDKLSRTPTVEPKLGKVVSRGNGSSKPTFVFSSFIGARFHRGHKLREPSSQFRSMRSSFHLPKHENIFFM